MIILVSGQMVLSDKKERFFSQCFLLAKKSEAGKEFYVIKYDILQLMDLPEVDQYVEIEVEDEEPAEPAQPAQPVQPVQPVQPPLYVVQREHRVHVPCGLRPERGHALAEPDDGPVAEVREGGRLPDDPRDVACEVIEENPILSLPIHLRSSS